MDLRADDRRGVAPLGRALDKTWPVFAVLVFVVVCSVAAMLAAMAAPLAAVAPAAVLHGIYYCDRVTSPCLIGAIPY
jgi:hypothetical protein